MHLFYGKQQKKQSKQVKHLALTAEKLKKMGIVEYVVDEGEGAHLHPEQVMQDLKVVLKYALDELAANGCN